MPRKIQIIDEGRKRKVYAGGARREISAGKGSYELIPRPGIHRLALHYEAGAMKYGVRNWEKGIPIASALQSLIRHAYQYLDGDNSEDHLAAIAWNAFCAITMEEWAKSKNKVIAKFYARFLYEKQNDKVKKVHKARNRRKRRESNG